MNNAYWKSMLVAVLGGTASAVTQASQSGASLKSTGSSALVGAIGTALAYWLESPRQPAAPPAAPAQPKN